jgi:hypothetical protein
VIVGVTVRVLYTNPFTTAISPSVGKLRAVNPPTMLAPTTEGLPPSKAAQSNGAPWIVAGVMVGIGTAFFSTEW